MPPRPSQQGGAARGGGRGGGRGGTRGGPPPRTGPQLVGRGAQMTGTGGQPSGLPAAHVKTVGVRRRAYGVAGKKLTVHTNACEAKVPQGIIYHYDAIMTEKTLPPRFAMQLIKQLQLQPEFAPAGAYDGKKNLFMPHLIDMGGANSREYNIVMNGNSAPRNKPPRVFKIRITKVAEVNPEVLARFIDGGHALDESVQTALTALNVIIRMLPMQTHPFNSRSFFTDNEIRNVGHGLQLRRGYFQSLRPTFGRLLLNMDLSTGMFYRDGQAIDIALEVIGQRDPNTLSIARGLPDRVFKELERHLKNVRISVQPAGPGSPPNIVVISSLTKEGARSVVFSTKDGGSTNVASYFQRLSGHPLRYPDIVCAKTARGAVLPLERCSILPGQLARMQIPPDVTREMVEFSTKPPADRLNSIRNGFQVLGYGQSEYVRNFGLAIDERTFPMSIEARQLPPPQLLYGPGSKERVAKPRDGAWNMIDKKLYKPETIYRWAMVVFESSNRFRQDTALLVVRSFVEGCQSVGINVEERDPVIEWASGQGGVQQVATNAGGKCARKNNAGKGPDMILVILPDGGNDIYRAVKFFGDVAQGVATQCLKASKCNRAKPQYWANVCLKINPKLGGINLILDTAASANLSDPQNPTIVMGADVMHPAPGSDAPSFSAVVGSVDSQAVKYIPRTGAQRSRQEIIADLYTMAKDILISFSAYQKQVEKKAPQFCKPKRLLFFRDGVSEGQFGQVMEEEVAVLKICQELDMSPKITFIIVGKRHHYRYNRGEADKSGNCPAGTVVDSGITHPLEFDFYLQSHGGLLGTSRSAHYSVLYDDNIFSPDALQALCYLLCYIYARATRSVSIPAPVYYADIVCSRAKNHYDPNGVDLSDAASTVATENLQSFIDAFRPLHNSHKTKMYFMVSAIE
ncbi:argonaute-like protein [Lentinula aciculospora]|uniref:Argonaute-like protein n=1 Tax=Lentinula aciculospora TaxID=153920 RepID=A0A9W9AH15_9AGAR|nr:argonaute-like protein [Lentinula aciculospora]